ncbi:MAG: hypothetical protein PHF03_03055, partial [Syntrophomonadaceae bacterium]|nr:hypothetical protein [Syntrophomonadaceae bacterium]
QTSEQNVIIPFWQMTQDNSYYCGPATAAEIIRAKTFTSYIVEWKRSSKLFHELCHIGWDS